MLRELSVCQWVGSRGRLAAASQNFQDLDPDAAIRTRLEINWLFLRKTGQPYKDEALLVEFCLSYHNGRVSDQTPYVRPIPCPFHDNS